MKKLISLSFVWCFLHAEGKAQPYLYFTDYGPNSELIFNYINLATCEVCEHFSVPQPGGVAESVAILPNGNVLVINSAGLIVVYNPSNGNIVNSFTVGGLVSTAVLAPNGNLYYFKISGGSNYETCLYEFDPLTGNNVLIGCQDNYILTNAFFWNGTLYAFGYEGPPPNQNFGLFSVVPGSPLGITLVNSLPGLCGGSTAAIPGVGIFSTTIDANCSGNELYSYDLPGNTVNFECDLGNVCYCYGATTVPPGFPPPPANCGCETEAGEVSSANTVRCANETLVLASTGSELEPDDALAYILFTDLTDTLGSIVLTSTTPGFSFSDPPLQTGVTYYVAAIAGNELPGGGVDLADICLDISNALEVVWNPLPSIGFAVTNPDVCLGGCTTVEVTLTGTPPFSLTYNTPGNPGQTASFSGLTGMLQACVPGNAPPGSFSLQAVSLTDANCVCD